MSDAAAIRPEVYRPVSVSPDGRGHFNLVVEGRDEPLRLNPTDGNTLLMIGYIEVDAAQVMAWLDPAEHPRVAIERNDLGAIVQARFFADDTANQELPKS